MISIIHGDDTVASRNKLREMIEYAGDREVVYLDGLKLDLNSLILACEASSMLFSQKLVVIEGLFSRMRSKSKDEIITYLNGIKLTPDVILYESKKIEKQTIKKNFPKAEEYAYSYPVNLFKFLDSLGVERGAAVVQSFHNLLKITEGELVFAMIMRLWRNLIIIRDKKNLEPAGLAGWQIGKLRRQSGSFTQAGLIANYRQLLSIDYRIKSGLTPFTLTQLLDIFLINL